MISLWRCEKEERNTLTVSEREIEFESEGGSASITIETDADSWSIDNPASNWLIPSSTSGTLQKAIVSMRVSTKTVTPRINTLTITAGDAKQVYVIVTQASSEYLYSLTTYVTSLSFKRASNSATLTITTDAPQWNLGYDADWLQVSQETGNEATANISVTAIENEGVDSRLTVITVSAEYARSVEISVSQKGEYYPSYNTSPLDPDPTGISSTATELAAQMHLGWNLGNSLETMGSETAWGNPRVSKALNALLEGAAE